MSRPGPPPPPSLIPRPPPPPQGVHIRKVTASAGVTRSAPATSFSPSPHTVVPSPTGRLVQTSSPGPSFAAIQAARNVRIAIAPRVANLPSSHRTPMNTNQGQQQGQQQQRQQQKAATTNDNSRQKQIKREQRPTAHPVPITSSTTSSNVSSTNISPAKSETSSSSTKSEGGVSTSCKYPTNEPTYVTKNRKRLRKKDAFRHGRDKNCLWRRRWILMKTLEGDIPVLTWVRADEDYSDSDDDDERAVPGNLGGKRKGADLLGSKTSTIKPKKPRVFQTSMHVCQECSKPFVEASALKKHMRTHGEKKHVCQEPGCNKAFVESSKLKRHMMVHTGEKPFSCPYPNCGRDFGLDYNLRKHVQQMHGNEPLLSCRFPGCNKKFIDELSRKQHMSTHQTPGTITVS